MFNWKAYFELANDLAKAAGSASDPEAHMRAAISRAYYAAYCAARNHARDCDNLYLGGGSDDHSAVRSHFENAQEKARRKIGADLDRLRITRNEADYDDVMTGLPNKLAASLRQAENVLNKLDAESRPTP